MENERPKIKLFQDLVASGERKKSSLDVLHAQEDQNIPPAPLVDEPKREVETDDGAERATLDWQRFLAEHDESGAEIGESGEKSVIEKLREYCEFLKGKDVEIQTIFLFSLKEGADLDLIKQKIGFLKIPNEYKEKMLELLKGGELSKSEEKRIKVSDEELELLFEHFGFEPFSVAGYCGFAGVNEKNGAEILDSLVSEGELNKNPNGTYSFVPEDEEKLVKDKESPEIDTGKAVEKEQFEVFYKGDKISFRDDRDFKKIGYVVVDSGDNENKVLIRPEQGGMPYNIKKDQIDEILGKVSEDLVGPDTDEVLIEKGQRVSFDVPKTEKEEGGTFTGTVQEDVINDDRKIKLVKILANVDDGPRWFKVPIERVHEITGEQKEKAPEENPSGIKAETEEERGFKTAEEINGELNNARSEYASELNKWKNENRKRKKWFRKIQEDLGFTGHEKKLEEHPKSDSFKNAEKRYREAKRQKADYLGLSVVGEIRKKGNSIDDYERENAIRIRDSLLSRIEEEYNLLTKQIEESAPPLEKGIISKGLQKWSKLPLWMRTAISTAILTGAGVAFGSIGASGAVAYAGYRFGRGLAGVGVAKATGGIHGAIQEKKNEGRKEKAFEEYATGINMENFEDKEKQFEEFFNKQKNLERRQKLYKAATMAAAGLGTATLGNVGQSMFAPEVPQNTGLWGSIKRIFGENEPTKVGGIRTLKPTSPENIPQTPQSAGGVQQPESINTPKSSALDQTEKSNVKANIPQEGVKPNTNIPEPAKGGSVAETELSSKGFIKTIDDMKGKLTEKYGDKIPSQYKPFMETPSAKLAEDYGLYKSGSGESAMGMKGETISLNAKGQLEYHGLDGKTSIIDSNNKFGGKMFKSGIVEAKSVTEPIVGDKFIPEEKIIPGSIDEIQAEKSQVIDDTRGKVYEQDISKSGMADQSRFGGLNDADTSGIKIQNYEYEPNKTPVQENPLTTSTETVSMPKGGHEVIREFDFGKSHVDFIEKGGVGKVLQIGNIELGHEQPSGSGKILTLDDKFQNGSQYKDIRTAFASAFEKLDYTKNMGEVVKSADFEGGKLHVVQGIGNNQNALKVFLNGKEIAGGAIDEKGVANIELGKGLAKIHWWQSETVYQRALKKSIPILQTLIKK